MHQAGNDNDGGEGDEDVVGYMSPPDWVVLPPQCLQLEGTSDTEG